MAESIAEFFLEHFQAHRQECAYRQRRGYRTESFTYGEVLEMALGFARELESRGIAKGDRVIKATDFFVEMLTTALQPGEVLREIRIPGGKGKIAQAYVKVRHPASGFAVVGVAVNLSVDGGKCQSAGIGITGVSPKAYRAASVESALKGNALDAKTLGAAAAHAADGVDVNSDLYASAEYRKQLATVYTRRALEIAAARAK